MGEVAEEINKPSFVSSANWTISKGSLSDSISFETPLNDEEEHQEFQDDPKTLKQQQQQFVVLNPSSSSTDDSTPCEIKHEETRFDQNFIVDFELPILDVKFTPVERSNSRCSIESLLSASANDVGNPCTQNDGSNVVISEEEDGSNDSEVDRILVDVGNIVKNTDNSSMVPFFASEDSFIYRVEDSCAQEDNSSVVVTGQSQVLLDNESNGPEDANHLLVEKSDDTESNFQSPGIDSKVPDLSQGIGSKIPDWFEISSYI